MLHEPPNVSLTARRLSGPQPPVSVNVILQSCMSLWISSSLVPPSVRTKSFYTHSSYLRK